MFFSRRIFNILRPFPRKNRAAIGCTENGQPIRVTVHSDLRSDDLISYMQGMGCSKGKNAICNEHPLCKLLPARPVARGKNPKRQTFQQIQDKPEEILEVGKFDRLFLQILLSSF